MQLLYNTRALYSRYTVYKWERTIFPGIFLLQHICSPNVDSVVMALIQSFLTDYNPAASFPSLILRLQLDVHKNDIVYRFLVL